jgi:SHQ1 protein
MPITPHFTISEPNMTQIELQIHVPHVRFSVEEIQISLSHHNTTLHFYCPPIYLLVLNFAPYQFRNLENDDDDGADIDVVEWEEEHPAENGTNVVETNATISTTITPVKQHQQQQQQHRATYLPHVQNGMIQLIFEKHVHCQYHWENLDLLGKLQQPSSSSSSQRKQRIHTHDIFAAAAGGSTSHSSIPSAAKLQWLREIVNEEEAEDAEAEEVEPDDDPSIATEPKSLHDRILTQPSTNNLTKATGTYGFDRMFAHIYDDLQRENSILTQMLECPWPSNTTSITTTKHHCTADTHIVPTLSSTSRQTHKNVKIIDTDHDDDNLHCVSVTSIQRQRRQQRKEIYENPKFNAERYIQDIDIEECHDFIYEHAMTTIPHWRKPLPPSPSATTDTYDHIIANPPNNDYFTTSERQLLMSIPYPLLDDVSILQPPPLPNLEMTTATSIRNGKNDIMPYRRQWSLGMGLIDVLYAYVYDHLTTVDHEPTVESAWTISTLSTSLSWLHDWLEDDDDDDDPHRISLEEMVQSVVQSSVRRSLIYPYIRNFSFSIYIWEQVVLILQNTTPDSIRIIMRCLLQVRNILNFSDIYYFGNKLYIDPYLIWIQKYRNTNYLQHELLFPIAQCIHQHINNETSIQQLKHGLDLNLLQIEDEFYNNDVLDDEEAGECVTNSDNSTSSDGDDESTDDDDYDDDDNNNDHGTCSRSSVSSSVEEKTRTLEENDQLSKQSCDDVDAAVRGIQSLELSSKSSNTNSHNINHTNTKTSALNDLLSICNSFESLNTDVNKAAAPLIQEIE